MTSKAIIYIVVLFALIIVAVAADTANKNDFSCYICDSITNPNCGHGSSVNPEFIKPCDIGMKALVPKLNHNYTLCRKIVTVIDFDVNSNKKGERISRVCGWEKSKYDEECYYRGGLGGRTTVCTCTKSDCNGVSSFGAVAATIILPSIFLIAKSLSS